MLDQEKIVSSARSYLGVPHVHQGRHRSAGLDCVGLLVSVAQDVGAKWHDLTGYSRSGGDGADLMGRSLLRDHMEKSLVEIPIEECRAGDVWLFWVEKALVPHHVGIATECGFIHSDARPRGRGRRGSVREVKRMGRWIEKVDSAWRFTKYG